MPSIFFIDLVSACFEFFRSVLVSKRMLFIVFPNFTVAIIAKWDGVV